MLGENLRLLVRMSILQALCISNRCPRTQSKMWPAAIPSRAPSLPCLCSLLLLSPSQGLSLRMRWYSSGSIWALSPTEQTLWMKSKATSSIPTCRYVSVLLDAFFSQCTHAGELNWAYYMLICFLTLYYCLAINSSISIKKLWLAFLHQQNHGKYNELKSFYLHYFLLIFFFFSR